MTGQRRKSTNVKRGWHKCGVEDEVEERWNSTHDMACVSFCQCFFFLYTNIIKRSNRFRGLKLKYKPPGCTRSLYKQRQICTVRNELSPTVSPSSIFKIPTRSGDDALHRLHAISQRANRSALPVFQPSAERAGAERRVQRRYRELHRHVCRCQRHSSLSSCLYCCKRQMLVVHPLSFGRRAATNG